MGTLIPAPTPRWCSAPPSYLVSPAFRLWLSLLSKWPFWVLSRDEQLHGPSMRGRRAQNSRVSSQLHCLTIQHLTQNLTLILVLSGSQNYSGRSLKIKVLRADSFQVSLTPGEESCAIPTILCFITGRNTAWHLQDWSQPSWVLALTICFLGNLLCTCLCS